MIYLFYITGKNIYEWYIYNYQVEKIIIELLKNLE